MSILWLLAIPLPVGVLISLLRRPKLWILSALTKLFMLVYASYLVYCVFHSGEALSIRLTDTGLLGIGLRLDETSGIFVIACAFLFFIYGLFNRGIGSFNANQEFLLLTLESIIMLLFMTQDIFNLFVLLEVSTIICGTLIMLLRERRSVYDGLVYIMINTIGIMFYLLGVGMLYRLFGNLDIEFIRSQMHQVEVSQVLLPFAFILTGLSVKSALFPVFLWLPKAHGSPGAPAIVSALLSGIYIKAGLYAFIQMNWLFRDLINTSELLLVLGLLSALGGIVFAVLSKDIKLILAYHTVSQIGLIFIGISRFDLYSYYGGLMHMLNHALFKSLLFLSVGYVYRLYGSRQIQHIKGLWKRSPITGAALLVGMLGITGAPFFNGSISKYFIMLGHEDLLVTLMLHLVNFGTTLSFVKLGSILLGNEKPREKTNPLVAMAFILASISVLLTGIYGSVIFELLSGETYGVSISSQLEKGVYWIIYLGVAVLSFTNVLPRISLYRRGYNLDLEFNTMVFVTLISFIIYYGFAFFNMG